MKPRWNIAGVTLVELVLSIAIIGIALGSTVTAIFVTLKQSVDPLVQQQAIFIANTYLEEISGKPYADPDTDAVCADETDDDSRLTIDDACDFHGLNNLSGAVDQLGNVISGLDRYQVSVSIDTASALLNDLSGVANVYRVDVRVRHTSGKVDLTLSTYMVR